MVEDQREGDHNLLDQEVVDRSQVQGVLGILGVAVHQHEEDLGLEGDRICSGHSPLKNI